MPRRDRLLSTLLALVCLSSSPALADEPSAVDRKVSEGLEKALGGKGVEAHVALREIWRRWEQTDPSQVEEALRVVSDDAKVAPEVRAYAGLLRAYARRRRGDLEGAKAAIKGLGFIDEWLIVGPFDNEAKASLATAFGPEADLSLPLSLETTYEGKERAARWRVLPRFAGAYGWVDLGNALRPSEKVCAYATTFVKAKGDKGRDATVWVGASGAFKAFWNGVEVLADPEYRSLDASRLSAPVKVKPGWNRLMVKVCGDDDGPMLQVRLGDEKGGGPAGAFEVKADAQLGDAAAKNASRETKKAAPTPGVKVVAKGDPYARGAVDEKVAPKKARSKTTGPLAELSAVLSDKKASADVLEAHARYLALTGGDAKGQHTARDLAIRAAEAEPTVARMLLSAELAEDRNQRLAWITKARAHLAPDENDAEVTLAEALWARSGPNFRDATPYFERLLARDPGHVAGQLGRAELYEQAGLKHAALATLEKAVETSPWSVSLLRAYAHQLREVGRASDAEVVERRYANLRFDDVGYLRAQVEVAVARRDVAGATRWLERLLDLDPDAAGTLELAARAFRALGQGDRAYATLDKRLELCPEDVEAMRALADMYGEDGKQDEQLKLLRKILVLRPQAKDVREYVESTQPPKIRKDEAFALERDQLLALAKAPPPPKLPKRTLRELQVTTVYENGLASRFHQVAFQPLTDEAAAMARQYAFVYQAGREVVDVRAARVYRANGKVDEAIETGDGPADNPALAMYTSSRTFYVQLPRLSPGDVVELRYRVEEVTPRNEYGDSFSETTFLQGSDPVTSSEYVMITPKTRKVSVRLPQLPGLSREESDDGELHVLRATASDVPALGREPMMPPLAEVLASASASTFASWDDVGKWYWGLSKDQFDADENVRQKVRELTKGLTTDDDKVRAVYDYVVQRTRYVALEFGIEGFRPRRCAQTMARGWGDCKDKATVIVTMLRELGIEAHVVLVRTNLRGDAPTEPPSYAFFDHAIAYVPKLDLFLDGTAEYTGSRELPPFDRGAHGLIVSEKGAKLVRLPDPAAEQTVRSRKIELSLADQGPGQVEMKLEATGALAAESRQRYHAAATQRNRVQEDLSGELGGLSLLPGSQGLEVSDLENIEQPVKVRVKGKMLSSARDKRGEVSLQVGPGAGLVARLSSLSQRKHDVKLPFAYTLDDEWTIRLPQGAKVTQGPESKSVKSPFGSLEVSVDKGVGKVVVKAKLKLEKTRVSPGEYAAFRAFCEEVDRVLGDRLIVSK